MSLTFERVKVVRNELLNTACEHYNIHPDLSENASQSPIKIWWFMALLYCYEISSGNRPGSDTVFSPQ